MTNSFQSNVSSALLHLSDLFFFLFFLLFTPISVLFLGCLVLQVHQSSLPQRMIQHSAFWWLSTDSAFPPQMGTTVGRDAASTLQQTAALICPFNWRRWKDKGCVTLAGAAMKWELWLFHFYLWVAFLLMVWQVDDFIRHSGKRSSNSCSSPAFSFQVTSCEPANHLTDWLHPLTHPTSTFHTLLSSAELIWVADSLTRWLQSLKHLNLFSNVLSEWLIKNEDFP